MITSDLTSLRSDTVKEPPHMWEYFSVLGRISSLYIRAAQRKSFHRTWKGEYGLFEVDSRFERIFGVIREHLTRKYIHKE